MQASSLYFSNYIPYQRTLSTKLLLEYSSLPTVWTQSIDVHCRGRFTGGRRSSLADTSADSSCAWPHLPSPPSLILAPMRHNQSARNNPLAVPQARASRPQGSLRVALGPYYLLANC